MIDQLKNRTAREWIRALTREGFRLRKGKGAHHIYQHPDGRRVLVVYHKLSDTFGPKTLTQLLRGTGWTEADLKRFNLSTVAHKLERHEILFPYLRRRKWVNLS